MNEIKEQLADINHAAQSDCEEAHYKEKQLLISFIEDIAENWSGELAEKARLVLTVRDIEFKRYFA